MNRALRESLKAAYHRNEARFHASQFENQRFWAAVNLQASIIENAVESSTAESMLEGRFTFTT